MIAFTLPGGIPVYAFSLLAGVGVCTGLAWTARRAPEKKALQRVDAGLWILLGALIGGRAAYATVNWSYFQEHQIEIIMVHMGGLAWPGALAGGLIALAVTAAASKDALASLADDLCPLATALTVCLWLGCWLDGVAYGAQTEGWWGLPARDEFGALASRFPVQLLAALAAIGWFWTLEGLTGKKKIRPGMLSSLTFLGLSLSLLAVSLLRADPGPAWHGLRVDAWAAVVFTLLALASVVVANLLARRKAVAER